MLGISYSKDVANFLSPTNTGEVIKSVYTASNVSRQ